jgi:hypothetical protein
MPKVSKDSVEAQDQGPVLDYSGEVDGYTVNFVTFRPADLDHTACSRAYRTTAASAHTGATFSTAR